MAQSRTAVNAKASGAEPMKKLTDTGAVPAGGETQQVGGPTPGDMSAQPTVSPSVVPGGGSTDGTNSGRGAGGDPQPTVGKEASYEHVQIDRNAAAHLDELAEGQDASDEFKMKAKVIFEGALNQKLQLEVSRLEEEFSTRFEQEITDIAEKVEAFLNYTSQQWLSFLKALWVASRACLKTITFLSLMRSTTSLSRWSLNLMIWKTS